MDNKSIIREALLENTIRLIGEGGFEKSTTHAIVSDGVSIPGIRLNEVYIYRIFGSKEQLYADLFSVLDNELFSKVGDELSVFQNSDADFSDLLKKLFDSLWRFLLDNETRTRCYVRYFYSQYYREKSMRDHRKLLDKAAQKFSFAFKEESNVRALIHESFITMVDFAVQVFNGDLEDDEENSYHIFNLLYHSWYSYLKPELIGKKE